MIKSANAQLELVEIISGNVTHDRMCNLTRKHELSAWD